VNQVLRDDSTKPLPPDDLYNFDKRESNKRASIVIYNGDETRLIDFSSTRTFLVVGRGTFVDMRIDDDSLSREHASFAWNGDDRLSVMDLGSTNGTRVNGKEATKNNYVRLKSGDEVLMGNVRAVAAIMGDGSSLKPPASCRIKGIAGTENLVILNPAMKTVYQQVFNVAQHDTPVLILGETGTGKEHVANALHAAGPRSKRRFVAVNCASIPPDLIQSTLFGHERGAFTSATSSRAGVFEQASGGVLFLDEVGELSLDAQASLLRAVETGRITRIGSSRSIEVDVRIVSATNCDVEQMVEDKSFRKDLLYRLNSVTLQLPPLRERRDEIEPLAELFLACTRESWNQAPATIDRSALKVLREYDWPGNIRQLKNVIETSALTSSGNSITAERLPITLTENKSPQREAPLRQQDETDLCFEQRLKRWEIELFTEALRRTGGNQSAAAVYLRMSRRTLVRKLNAYGLNAKQLGAAKA
jgi:two-component system response regulator AtoC